MIHLTYFRCLWEDESCQNIYGEMNHAKKSASHLICYWGSWWWQAQQSTPLYQSSSVLLFHLCSLGFLVTNLLITSILLTCNSCIWISTVENEIKLCLLQRFVCPEIIFLQLGMFLKWGIHLTLTAWMQSIT